jgi:N-acetylglucosamine malate deacetylase 1
MMPVDLLAIAAHPDDVELTCGGTLIKMARRGYRVGILDLTRGEMGTRGSAATRRREAAAAARALGVHQRSNLGLPDARLAVTEKARFAVARKIRLLRPHTVILPYWEGRHPDHYNAAQIAYEGCFTAGLKRLAIPGEPFRPFKLLYATAYDPLVRPTFVVDITAEYAQRQRAILCYASQFRPKRRDRRLKVHIPLDELDRRVGLMARHFGQLIGVEYGEPFLVKELLEVDDVVRLPVRSI